MLAFILTLIILNPVLYSTPPDSSSTDIKLVVDSIAQSQSLIEVDTVKTWATDTASYYNAMQEPTLGYIIEKHISRAIKAAKETLAALHVKGRFPIHIILFTICFSIVVITAIDASKKKKSKN